MTAPLVSDAPVVLMLTESPCHAFCTLCAPPNSGAAVTLCGEIDMTPERPRFAAPPNACVVCLDLWSRPCGRCGR
jgi:hypothetical protein